MTARNPCLAVLLLLMIVAGCDRDKPKHDKIDDLPRGTGGTPATQTTAP